MYRKYNSTLPYWLRDKPQKLVKHCVERLTSAGSFKDEHVRFSSSKKANILNKQMLTDESINIAQNILEKQFPKIAGLQDTAIGKTQAFDIIRNEEKCIQILHAGSFHSILLPTHKKNKTDNSYCQIYNSLTNGSVPLDVAKQTAAFSYCESAEVVAEVLPVQQQTNCVDCGLFATAFATTLAHNENPVRRVYDTTKLRQHLVRVWRLGKCRCFHFIVQMKKKTSKQHLMLLKSNVHAECHTAIQVKTMI